MKGLGILLALSLGADARAEDPQAGLGRLRAESRRAERRDVVALAEAADRLAAGGSASAWRLAGDLYLVAYRGYRDPRDLSTALDRLEHASRGDGTLGCDAGLEVARVHAELGRREAGYVAFHRLAKRCPEGAAKAEADRAMGILAPFRPAPEVLAAVDRDPTAPIPASVAPATATAPIDAGPPVDAAPATTAAPAPDAGPTKRGREKIMIRFTDGGAR